MSQIEIIIRITIRDGERGRSGAGAKRSGSKLFFKNGGEWELSEI